MVRGVQCKLSQSQQQYWDVKSKYRDVVLFFKIGKFYELYEEDAQIGHDELGWKLTVSGVGHCRQVYLLSPWSCLRMVPQLEASSNKRNPRRKEWSDNAQLDGLGRSLRRQVGCPESGVEAAAAKLVARGHKVRDRKRWPCEQ